MKLFRSFSFLTREQKAFFDKNGYLYLPKLIPNTEIAEAKIRAYEHIDSWVPSSNHPVFTNNDLSLTTNDYFFKSAYKISFFLEDSAKPPIANKRTAVNKIGHALHDLDNVFRKFSYRKEYKLALNDLGYTNPQIVQSMFIIKGPKVGGEIKPHQDCSYIITEPASCIGIWVAMEEASSENACMYAVPGSHKSGTQVFWERNGSTMTHSNPFQYSTANAVCLEAKPGTAILLHGDLVHWSEHNRSDKSRHAYTLHIVKGDYEWSPKNWLQRPSFFPFRTWDS